MESKAGFIRAIRSAAAGVTTAVNLANDLITEIEAATPILLRLVSEVGFVVRDEKAATEYRAALDQMRDHLLRFKASFDERLNPIDEAASEHLVREGKARQVTAEPNANRIAQA